MSFGHEKLKDLVVLTASGRIDLSNADDFGQALSAALADARAVLILDFSGIEYISSAGLRSLLIAFKTAKTENTVLAVAALRPLVLEIFEISRFDLVIPLFGTVRDAVSAHAAHALSDFDAR